MAGIRCWDNYPSKLNRNSSYFTQKVKSKSIYGYMKGVANTNGPLPKTSCGCKYYGGLYLNPNTKCLVHADNYELLLDVTKGQYYCSSDLSSNTIPLDRELYQGAILQSNYTNVNVVLPEEGLDSSFNYVIWPPPSFSFSGDHNLEFPGCFSDPCGQIFYSNCDNVPWFTRSFGSVDISYSYIESINYTDPSGIPVIVPSQYAALNNKQQDLVCFKFPKCLQFS
jgi:hypothetical protein